jgi:hypothetical protein
MLAKGEVTTAAEKEEKMNLELWVRHSPESNRQLALWAESLGILYDRTMIRAEELSLSSGNASVRAFLEGQPQYVCADTLPSALSPSGASALSSSNHWRTFLSVPIRAQSDSDGVPVDVPVGVVTLATTKEKQHSSIPFQSSAEMSALVAMLTGFGEFLLQA